MKKKTPKKLEIVRETLRHLDPAQRVLVRGGEVDPVDPDKYPETHPYLTFP